MADHNNPEAIKILQRGDPGISRLEKIVKQYDINYTHAQKDTQKDMRKADTKMIEAIDRLPGKKTMTEHLVKRIMQVKNRPYT